MPTNKQRINLALPDDLQQLVVREADAMRIPAATRVTQIIDLYFKRLASETQQNAKVLKGSQLLVGSSEVTIDVSGGSRRDRVQSDHKSQDVNGG